MSVFADLLDLRTAVIEQVGRPDIADVFPRFVAMAESRLNRSLRMREQISNAVIAFYDGTGSLPDDFSEMIGLFAPNGAEYVQQSPQHMTGYTYSVRSGLIVSPLISGDATALYYATIPALEAMTDSNWLLERYPDIYLYSVAFEAAKHGRDKEMAGDMRGLMDEAIATAKADDDTARYSRARVRVAGCTP
jgi:Tol biopolymer transport system component